MTKLQRSVEFSLENILEFKKSSTVENYTTELGKINFSPPFYPQLSMESLLGKEFACIGRGPSEDRYLMGMWSP